MELKVAGNIKDWTRYESFYLIFSNKEIDTIESWSEIWFDVNITIRNSNVDIQFVMRIF